MNVSQTLLQDKEEERQRRKTEHCPVETATHHLAVFFSGNSYSFEGMDLKMVASSKHCGVFFIAACCAYGSAQCGRTMPTVRTADREAVHFIHLLDMLASVGLGTGLHTFLLHLGPHIASVTLVTYECKAVEY